MAGAASSPAADPPPTSSDATKIALALSVIFILCIFGTAFGARQCIRRQIEAGLSDHQGQHQELQQQRRRRNHWTRGSAMTRPWPEMETVAGQRTPNGRRIDGGTNRRTRRGLAADKIARFSVVSFHDQDLRHIEARVEEHDQAYPQPQRIIVRTQPQGSDSIPASRTSCSICTDDLAEGVHVRRLPCGHVFHPACVDQWLRERARTCPLW
ncbi:hypothetical protein Micbo1qcDRAFT_206128 [Microdochium bolleyi]|uniref:RING-type domain-containing protein n=1 Tax=Microdochium bolleyi TaxID=196109 RepID=A0A136IY32_9PEZI|nr:hypothetical protein Micbo1qcDRAFT_206128 [Microdochium bolleyi]